jgi:uncharacterized protein (DUF1697 family)
MQTYIALFRGINVGGKHSLPMKELASLFETWGAENVKTYIQSGNVVFHIAPKRVSSLTGQLKSEILERYGFNPNIVVIDRAEIESVIANNPFPEAEADPSSLHVGFLASEPVNPNLEKLESLKKSSERYCLLGKSFYLYAPEGVGRSKLAASSEKLLGTPMTDRNWKTVCKLREMAMK